jgi:anti-repressor protein
MTEYGFEEDKDFNLLKNEYVQQEGSREVARDDYQLTIEMAKEIAMVQRNDKGKEVRQYFINLEKSWNTPEKIMARALKVAQETIDSIKHQILLDKPKVEFFDQVTSSKDAIDMATCAKVLNIKGFGRNNLFEFLRDKNILQANNVPYQRFIDRGYFRVIENKYNLPDGSIKINIKTIVYQSGMNYIKKLINEREEVKCL